jgi:hypothetical protein
VEQHLPISNEAEFEKLLAAALESQHLGPHEELVPATSTSARVSKS